MSNIGPADLLRLWIKEPNKLEDSARLLGFAKRVISSETGEGKLAKSAKYASSEVSGKKTKPNLEYSSNRLDDHSNNRPPDLAKPIVPSSISAKVLDRDLSETKFPYVSYRRHTENFIDRTKSQLPEWTREKTTSFTDKPQSQTHSNRSWPSLVREPLLKKILQKSLNRKVLCRDPDIERLISHIAAGRPVNRIFRSNRRKRISRLVLLFEDLKRMRSIRRDAINVNKILVKNWGTKNVFFGNMYDYFGRAYFSKQVPKDTALIILSDFELNTPSPDRLKWLPLFKSLAYQYQPTIFLIPASLRFAKHLPAKGVPSFNWDRGMRPINFVHRPSEVKFQRKEFLDFNKHSESQIQNLLSDTRLSKLLACISITYRAEPEIIRHLRNAFNFGVETEIQVRCHPHVIDDGWFIYISSEFLDHYRKIFSESLTDAEKKECIEVVKKSHRHGFLSILDQELDVASTLCDFEIGGVSDAEERLRSLSVRAAGRIGSGALNSWIKSHLDFQNGADPERIAHFYYHLHESALGSASFERLRLPRGLRLEYLSPYLKKPTIEKVLVVSLSMNRLVFSLADSSKVDYGLSFRASGIRIIVANLETEVISVNDKLLFLREGFAHTEYAVDDLPLDINTGYEEFRLVNICRSRVPWATQIGRDKRGIYVKTLDNEENNKLGVEEYAKNYFPSWGGALTKDEYGIYTDLVLGDHVRQRFRLIEVFEGEYVSESQINEFMEQPEDKTTHKVWLADSACSQALWRSVMGENPSHNKSSHQNPVECVSLDQVLGFLGKLNEMIPELNARLPEQWEWEIACRAGSRSIYSFGDTLSSDQVNSLGSQMSKIGTVRVKMGVPNSFGMYHMNGNVWEWTSTPWVEASHKASRSSQNSYMNDDFTICGGSWTNSAELCRSSSVTFLKRDFYNRALGFRFVVGE